MTPVWRRPTALGNHQHQAPSPSPPLSAPCYRHRRRSVDGQRPRSVAAMAVLLETGSRRRRSASSVLKAMLQGARPDRLATAAWQGKAVAAWCGRASTYMRSSASPSPKSTPTYSWLAPQHEVIRGDGPRIGGGSLLLRRSWSADWVWILDTVSSPDGELGRRGYR
jgi:hypothetical protein